MIPLPPGAMEPVLWPGAFNDPAWAFQIKWDGMRLLTASGPSLRAFNRHGQERTAWFPELADLPPTLEAAEAVVDGEAVALLQGRPNFRRLMQRVRSREPARLAGEIAVTYVIFDLLALDGRDLRPLPWEERQSLLRERLHPAGPIAVVDTVPTEGRMLFGVALQHDLEGIVAKRLDSPYVAGKSDLWRKAKCVKRRPFVIVGYRWHAGRLGSLLLAAHDEAGRLVYVGNAGTGLDEATLQALRQVLDENRADPPPPLLDRPRAPGASRDVWVWPVLTVLVEFLEWTEDLKLRAPVIRALNPTTPAECRLD